MTWYYTFVLWFNDWCPKHLEPKVYSFESYECLACNNEELERIAAHTSKLKQIATKLRMKNKMINHDDQTFEDLGANGVSVEPE